MKLGSKNALGIDISETRIRLVLLKGGSQGAELVNTASLPVPKGAIKDGNVADAALLAHALKELKVRNKISWTNHAAVSLLAHPLVLQIIELPSPLPTNVGQFVQNEVKRCVALSGKTVSFDYCRVGSGREGEGRLLVVATDEQKVAALAEVCSRAGLNVEAIEPPVVAWARALYPRKIAGESDSNLLLATLRDGILTLCVFRGQSLDFVRTKSISEREPASGALCEWIARELNAIIRFYDFEVTNVGEKWEIVVAPEDGLLPEDGEQLLRGAVPTASVQLRTAESAWQDTPFAKSACSEDPSVVGIGLAMRLLGMDGANLRIDLAPPESAEVRSVKNHVLLTANIAALLLLVMILAAGALGWMTRHVNRRIGQEKRGGHSRALHSLLQEQEVLEKQLRQLSNRPDQMDVVSGGCDARDWSKILEDIRARTPKAVRITELYGKKDSGMYLAGSSLSYEAVHLFVDLLNKSKYIESASPIQTERDRELDGMVKYSINCVLAPRQKGE
ncbi:MAG TPA: pilus assembly protein PilM [Sedimentisphaerales bacterium]|nr:pilus assembly protein PilM [Sedimentisphaerales bacterium]